MSHHSVNSVKNKGKSLTNRQTSMLFENIKKAEAVKKLVIKDLKEMKVESDVYTSCII